MDNAGNLNELIRLVIAPYCAEELATAAAEATGEEDEASPADYITAWMHILINRAEERGYITVHSGR